MSAQAGASESQRLGCANVSTAATPPRIRFFNNNRHVPHLPPSAEYSPDDIVALWNQLEPSVLVIENSDDALIRRLSQPDISPNPVPASFWRCHESDPVPQGVPLWDFVFSCFGNAPDEDWPRCVCSIRGIFEYGHGERLTADSNCARWRRPEAKTLKYGWISATRITYGRFGRVYIILVDAPRFIERSTPAGDVTTDGLSPSQKRPVLRLPYVASTTGGLLLPHLFLNDHCSLLESFESFFSHGWHLGVLFSQEELIDPHILLTLLCISLWRTNLQLLRADIEFVSFVEMRKQTRLRREETSLVNDRLHDRREDLAFLRREVQYLRKYLPSKPKQIAQALTAEARKGRPTPDALLDEVLEDSNLLQLFLMDTFQLWMAILRFENTLLNIDQARVNNQIAVDNGKILEANHRMAADGERRADESTHQTSRATALTLLAALYLPMTLASGLFGMNINALSDSSKATLGQFGATLGALSGATVLVMVIYYLAERRAVQRQQKARGAGGREGAGIKS